MRKIQKDSWSTAEAQVSLWRHMIAPWTRTVLLASGRASGLFLGFDFPKHQRWHCDAKVPFVTGRATEPDPVRRITTNETRINAKGDAAAVLFNAPGSYRTKGGSYADFRNSNKPGLGLSMTLDILDGDKKVIPRWRGHFFG